MVSKKSNKSLPRMGDIVRIKTGAHANKPAQIVDVRGKTVRAVVIQPTAQIRLTSSQIEPASLQTLLLQSPCGRLATDFQQGDKVRIHPDAAERESVPGDPPTGEVDHVDANNVYVLCLQPFGTKPRVCEFGPCEIEKMG